VQQRDESVAETATVVHSASQRDVRHASSSSSAAAAASAASAAGSMHRSVTFSGFDNLHRLTGRQARLHTRTVECQLHVIPQA